MAVTKLRGSTQLLSGSITNNEISSTAGILTSKLAEGNSFLKSDGSVIWVGDQDAGSKKLTNLAAGTNPNDAVTVSQLSSHSAGLDAKESVRVATTGSNIGLSGLPTIDGVVLNAGDRILVKDQAIRSENGIYIVSSGAWTRASDADDSSKVSPGMYCFVEEGSSLGDTGWILITDGSITLGTTNLDFTQFSGSGSVTYTAGTGLSLAGATFNVNMGDGVEVDGSNNLRIKLDGATISRSVSGLKLSNGTAPAQLLVTNTANEPVYRDITGDVTVSEAGITTINSGAVGGSAINWTNREAPSGAIDGANTTFVLSFAPAAGTEMVFLNGILLQDGGEDYTLAGSTLTMTNPPMTGDRLLVSYWK